VTNNHVVDGATTIEVTFYDDVTVSATVVGTDPDSDLAVIKIDPTLHELVPVKVADFQTLKVGQIVMAIGNPFGLNGTLTSGIISAMGRELPVDNSNSTSTTSPAYSIPDVIQTDAAINPGNSGGPLLNINGEVVGVNTAIESNGGSSSGVGFAVPIAIVQRVVPALVKDGAYHHPWLGVTVMTLGPEVADAMGLPKTQRGAMVVGITSGSPSEKAGLQTSTKTVDIGGQSVEVGGDVIVKIDGKTVAKSEDLISYLVRETFVGQEVTLTVLRDGKEITLKAVLAARPTVGNTLTSWNGGPAEPGTEST
jgi:serine protease Do